MNYFVSNKLLLYNDTARFKKMIIKRWKIDQYISNPKNAEILVDFLMKHYLRKSDKTIFIYKNFKLEGCAFLGLPSKRNSQRNVNYEKLTELFMLNQSANDNEFLKFFIYIFNIKALFEWKVLTNDLRAGFIIDAFFADDAEDKEGLNRLLILEANKVFNKNDLRTAHFANINYESDWIVNLLNAKEIYNIDLPFAEFVNNPNFVYNHVVISWFSYYLNPEESNQDLKLNVYGLYVNPWSMFNETIKGYDPNAKYTFLMIHGVAADHKTWNPEIEFLRQYGNIELIDLPLHGNSNVFPLNAISWDLTAMGLYVSDFVRVKKLKNIIIWGHSLGGGVAILTWFNCQDLVKGLILEDAYNPGALTTKASFLKGIIQAASNHVKYLIWKKENEQFSKSHQVENEINKVVDVYKPMSKKIVFFLTNLLNQHVRYFIDWVYMQNRKLKTLVMFGANDFVINEELSHAYFDSLTPNYEFYTVPNANHSSHSNNPEFVMNCAKKYLEETLGLKPYKPDQPQPLNFSDQNKLNDRSKYRQAELEELESEDNEKFD